MRIEFLPSNDAIDMIHDIALQINQHKDTIAELIGDLAEIVFYENQEHYAASVPGEPGITWADPKPA